MCFHIPHLASDIKTNPVKAVIEIIVLIKKTRIMFNITKKTDRWMLNLVHVFCMRINR